MVENKQYVYKNRKYAFQFPEDVSSDDQAKYLNALNDAWEKDDVVTIDPKIKVYEKDYQETVKTEEPKAESTDSATDIPAETTKEEPKEEPVVETPKETKSEVKVTKVETTPKEEKTNENVLIGEEQ